MNICISAKSAKVARCTSTIRSSQKRFYQTATTRPKFDGVVLGCYAPETSPTGSKTNTDITLTKDGTIVDRSSNGNLQSILKLAKNEGSVGKVTVLYNNFGFDRLAVVGLGKMTKNQVVTKENIRVAASSAARTLKDAGAKIIGIESLGDFQAAAEGANLGTFHLNDFKTKQNQPEQETNNTPIELHPFTMDDIAHAKSGFEDSWKKGSILASAQNLARTLADYPANVMTPTEFARRACDELMLVNTANKENCIEIVIRDEEWARSKNMGCLLAVSKGSAEKLKFVEVHYHGYKLYGNNDQEALKKPFILVGKGITFDSGGISIKPAAGMGAMKGDMAGGASVVAALKAIAQLKVPINVIGLIPLCENMPSGNAVKPGDIVTSMKGKTIEVDNTDAEGRLILADALHYAHSFEPHTIVDVATLTGIALGAAASGAFTNSKSLWKEISTAASDTGEHLWRMPLHFPQYRKVLTSSIADLINVGDGGAGSCVAARFLKEFVDIPRWIHLDIAATSKLSAAEGYHPKGVHTGTPTRTLVRLAEILAQNPPPTDQIATQEDYEDNITS